MNFAAFGDVRCIAEGDKVVVRWTWRATHNKGEYMGIAPTGKQVTLAGITISRVVDGKTVEEWGEMDNRGMMQQLGVVPPPGQGGG
jgi:predicted ester cyclase